jgi:hypothetical protein
VKIDFGGSEEFILNGAGEFLARRCAEFISLEFHPTITGVEAQFRMDRLLRSHGYVLTAAGNGTWLYHLPGLETALAPLGRVIAIGPELEYPSS